MAGWALTQTSRRRCAPVSRAGDAALLDPAAAHCARRWPCHSWADTALRAGASCLTAARERQSTALHKTASRKTKRCHLPRTRKGVAHQGRTSRCPWNERWGFGCGERRSRNDTYWGKQAVSMASLICGGFADASDHERHAGKARCEEAWCSCCW